MRIAIDVDDTITSAPGFFAVLSGAFRAAGHVVYVVTQRTDRSQTETELKALGIAYDELVTQEASQASGTTFFDWKAETCRRLQIDILFEDMPEIVNGIDAATRVFMLFTPERGRVWYHRR